MAGAMGKATHRLGGTLRHLLRGLRKVEKRGKKKQINPIDRERPLITAQTGEIKDTLAAGFEEVSKKVASEVVKEMPESSPRSRGPCSRS